MSDELPTVSILTPTANRRHFLECLVDCIQHQTYPAEKLEWVVVDDGEELIEDLVNKIPFSHYRKLSKKVTIGTKRNICCSMASGEIHVCFDDDDYYPPERILHTVQALLANPEFNLAGTSRVFMFDGDLDQVFSAGPFGVYHGTCNTLAWRKRYADTHEFADVPFAEESSFTDDFNEPMIQLNPAMTLVHIAHGNNTVRKRIFSVAAYSEEAFRYRMADIEFETLVGRGMADRYRACCKETAMEMPDYDIVYICGMHYHPWRPDDRHLGGSEKAVVNLCSEWAAMGYRVAVFCELNTKGKRVVYKGVDYYHMSLFQVTNHYPTIILWRPIGLHPAINWKLHTDRILLDLHDAPMSWATPEVVGKIDYCMLKSQYQASLAKAEGVPEEKCAVQMNGIEIQDFLKDPGVDRDPYRFCYTSSYDRGLEHMLRYCWPRIRELEPRAELHVYYGLKLYDKAEEERVRVLIQTTPGVTDHGRCNIETIVREKYRSTFHLYFTDAVAETDCIAIRESLVAGCIPVISKSRVFAERDGLQFDGDPQSRQANLKVADALVRLMRNPAEVAQLREKLKRSKTIVSWKTVAQAWTKYLTPKQVPSTSSK